MKKIIYISILLFLFNCNQSELKIKETILCDNFSNDGICKEQYPEKRTYTINLPSNKNIQTWDRLADEMYFHTRETPGFILKFNRKFSPSEKKKLIDSFYSIYIFEPAKGKVEGFEIGDDWLGCFNYLGSMLKDRQKQIGELKSFYKTELIFPTKIEYRYTSDIIKGSVLFDIDLVIK